MWAGARQREQGTKEQEPGLGARNQAHWGQTKGPCLVANSQCTARTTASVQQSHPSTFLGPAVCTQAACSQSHLGCQCQLGLVWASGKQTPDSSPVMWVTQV